MAASRVAPEELSISTGRWQNWECDQRKPSLALLPILAKALGTTPAYLAGWQQTDTAPCPTGEPSPSGQPALVFDPQLLDKHGLSSAQLSILRVTDHVMAPDFERGDLVLIDPSRDQVVSNGVYALASSGTPLIRFVRRELGQGITVYSHDDKHAPPQHFTDEDFARLDVVGEVVFKGRWLIDA